MSVKIAVRNLSKSYPLERGRLCALEDVGFEVADGEFVSIVGPSGCGKSTLLHVLCGFEPPDRGGVWMDGQAVSRPTPRAVLIAQRGSVFPWMSVRHNVLFGAVHDSAEEREAMARRYIELVGLAGFEESFPAQLSGGMLQRVEVARALMARPDVLYMDEPFGALDALTRLRMRAELQRILSRDRHTCLLVTHDVEEALLLSDRVIVMSPRPGRVQRILDVAVPHPRALSSEPLVALKQRVLRELGLPDGEVERGAAAQPGRTTERPRALRPVPPAPDPSPARADVVVIGGGPRRERPARARARARGVPALPRRRVAVARALGALGPPRPHRADRERGI